jgi:multidrug efflux pump subunit AcrA (membrane-fusion protein)
MGLWGRVRGARRRWPLVIGATALAAVVLLVVVRAGRRGGVPRGVPLGTVARGDLVIEIRSVGEVQAVRSQTFGVPRVRASNVKIAWLVPEGARVAAGDTLARFDTTEIDRRVDELESRLTSARANLEKLHASQRARLADLEAQVEDQRNSVRQAELAMADVEYEARVDREKAQLALQRAQLAGKQAASRLEAQRTIDAAELTEQRVNIANLESQLASERDAQESHVLVAPGEGLVVYGTNWSGGGRLAKVKVGDQLYFGGVVIELPDLSALRIASWVNEARVNQLRLGQRCAVHVDALPDTAFHGSVSRINVLGRDLPEAEGVKVFDFDVVLEGTDTRLRPGMTATVTVHVDSLRDVVYAPIETVHVDAQGPHVLRWDGNRLQRVAVTVGRQNDFHVVLAAGVAPGDRLALRAPAPETGGE